MAASNHRYKRKSADVAAAHATAVWPAAALITMFAAMRNLDIAQVVVLLQVLLVFAAVTGPGLDVDFINA